MSNTVRMTSGNDKHSYSDAEMVRMAQNDLKHFGLLYEKYWESVYRFVFKRVRNEHKVKDITQEVFYKAMMSIEKYEDRGFAFTSWLFRIALNETSNMARRNQAEMIFRANSSDLLDLMKEVYDEERDHREDKVKEYLESLNEKELTLIQMRYFEKRKLKDVAHIIGVSESSCKVKMFRIMTKLRKKLGVE